MTIKYGDALKHGIQHPAFKTDAFEKAIASVRTTPEPAVVTGTARVHRPPLAPNAPTEAIRVRLIEPGWETYTGQYGPHEFVKGVSVEPMPQVFADRVAAAMRCVDADKGTSLGQAQRQIEATNGATVLAPEHSPHAPADHKNVDIAAIAVTKVEESKQSFKIFTYDQLCDLVDDEGIVGLRAIGDKWKVKGRAITDLIAAILSAQDSELERRKNFPAVPTAE